MQPTAFSRPARPRWLQPLAALLAFVALAFAAVPQARAAEDDPPGRAGRIADLQGSVSWYDHEQGEWAEAQRNLPLTSGDRVSTAAGARAELSVGSTVLRLGGGSELEVLRMDDERMVFQLHSGQLALRVRSREIAYEIELVTEEARLRPLRAGHYRLDRIDDTTLAGAWRGELRVEDPEGFTIAEGRRAELWREGRSRELRSSWGGLPADAFAAWVDAADARDERSASTRHVSPEMTGVEDLDRHGRWDRHPDYGAVWFPTVVVANWAPYRYGRWVWVRPWGWTWVDEAPWGFAPFHYGRWVHWRGRWGWVPGAYVARPVFAPALVAWVGGANWSVSVNIGGPVVGWVPLAPADRFVPWYRTSPRYVERVDRWTPPAGRPPPRRRDDGPTYAHQAVPGAVTVVPRDALLRRQPVPRAVVQPAPGSVGPQRLEPVAPPVWQGERRASPPPGVPARPRADNDRRGNGAPPGAVGPQAPRFDAPPARPAPRVDDGPRTGPQPQPQPQPRVQPPRTGDPREGRDGRRDDRGDNRNDNRGDNRNDDRPDVRREDRRGVPAGPGPRPERSDAAPAAPPMVGPQRPPLPQAQPAPQLQPAQPVQPAQRTSPVPQMQPVQPAPRVQPPQPQPQPQQRAPAGPPTPAATAPGAVGPSRPAMPATPPARAPERERGPRSNDNEVPR
ncbi:MAG: hypothetical protein KF683_09660 [Rubrivivax sp.]|nr:hypothetical protein [Rubrivivax sp.]